MIKRLALSCFVEDINNLITLCVKSNFFRSSQYYIHSSQSTIIKGDSGTRTLN